KFFHFADVNAFVAQLGDTVVNGMGLVPLPESYNDGSLILHCYPKQVVNGVLASTMIDAQGRPCLEKYMEDPGRKWAGYTSPLGKTFGLGEEFMVASAEFRAKAGTYQPVFKGDANAVFAEFMIAALRRAGFVDASYRYAAGDEVVPGESKEELKEGNVTSLCLGLRRPP